MDIKELERRVERLEERVEQMNGFSTGMVWTVTIIGVVFAIFWNIK